MYSLDSSVLESLGNRYQSLSQKEINQNSRVQLYQSMLPLIKEVPVFGTGLGTFFDVYPRFQPGSLKYYWINAHNDWLELIIETGIIGFLIVTIGVGVFFFRFIKLMNSRRDPYVQGIGVGVLGGSVAIFMHSLISFNLHIPANAFLFAVVAGLGQSALYNRKHHGRETSLAEYRSFKTNVFIRSVATGFIILGIFLFGNQILNRFLGERDCPTQINSTLKLERNPSMKMINRALSYEPAHSECRIKIFASVMSQKRGGSGIGSFSEETIHETQKAITQNPSQAGNYLILGSQYFALSFYDTKRQREHLDNAIRSYENAIFFNPRHYKTVFRAAALWIGFSRETVGSGQFELYSEKGFALLKKSLTLVPQRWKEAVKIARKFDKDKRVLKKLIPGSGNEGKYARIWHLANQWWDNPK